ncbi:MAG: cytochrome c3 family protein [Desulfuromonadaceae bacterium]|nr:cytochrome c3 family protein [Desulfuromonadaceae bacterium]MDD2847693.1 cytochrome c3 family protein [Desulfuromonadaceae bacterium]MDD4131061.1 cytochrome c3 family protein [Desulfuromonadaceae bacterium]
MRRARCSTGKKILAGLAIVMTCGGVSHASQQGNTGATVTIPPTPEQYSSEPQPLTAAQCAQCHPSLFKNLKNGGGRHRFACQSCHNSFHTYSPAKSNWEQIMPKCSSCHTTPHGAKVTTCSACHANPHAPKSMASKAQLTALCYDCHSSVRDELVKYPSKHSKLACMTCHTSHGYKPSCFDCHKPHVKGQALSTCLPCHPVHQPKSIKFGAQEPSSSCSFCHVRVYSRLAGSTSKHNALSCVTCHRDKHRFIPQCTDCHGKPHSQTILSKYPKCISCHLDAHDMPVMKKK